MYDIRLRLRLARAGAVTALIGLAAAGVAAPAAAQPSNPDPVQTLMTHISHGYTPADCHPTGDSTGALAAIECEHDRDPGIDSTGYALYPSWAAMRAAFDSAMANMTVIPWPYGREGPIQYHDIHGGFGHPDGDAVMLTDQSGSPYLVWTRNHSWVMGTSKGDADANALYEWWKEGGVR